MPYTHSTPLGNDQIFLISHKFSSIKREEAYIETVLRIRLMNVKMSYIIKYYEYLTIITNDIDLF